MKPQNLTFSFKRRLLILTRNKYLDNLQEYIDYKEAHNFIVDVNTAEQFSANNIPSASEIATFINSKLNSNERPQYILIVGNPVNDIPYSDGIIDKRSDPATDFEYLTEMQTQLKTCKRISGNVSIGRWPVFSENDVTTIANKTIQYELAMGKRNWNDMFATSVSGTGSNSFGRSQAKQMNMMADKLSEAGLQCERRDGRYWNTTLIDQVFKDSAHVNNTWLVIYTGLGYFTSLYNPMENFIGNTTNYVQSPILFSYACLTNACDTNTNFGRCFLSRSSSKGGIANYGSTTTTTINEDWYLSKLMLSVFSKNKSLGKNILCGIMNYYNRCRTIVREHQIKRYNLFGDPSINLKGYQTLPKMIKKDTTKIKSNKVKLDYDENSKQLIVNNSNNNLIYIILYDSTGRIALSKILKESNETFDCSSLRSGIYFVIGTSAKGEILANHKIIINS